MPLFDFVLEGGVRDPVVASGAVNAHLTSLDRPDGLDETVPIVVPVLSSLGPGTLATGCGLVLLLFVLGLSLGLGLLRLAGLLLLLGRREPAPFVRVRLDDHRARRHSLTWIKFIEVWLEFFSS